MRTFYLVSVVLIFLLMQLVAADGMSFGPVAPDFLILVTAFCGLYRGALAVSPRLRAGLLVRGRLVASLAADTPKYRVPASAPPDRRGPFRR